MSKEQDHLDAIESGLMALHRVAFQHQAWVDVQQRANITMDRASATLLKVVAKHEGKACRPHAVASYLGIEAPSVTRTVQELENAGLILKKPDPNDGRASNLTVTKKGQQQLAKLHAARHQRLQQATANWTTTDGKKLGKLLQRLADDLAKTM